MAARAFYLTFLVICALAAWSVIAPGSKAHGGDIRYRALLRRGDYAIPDALDHRAPVSTRDEDVGISKTLNYEVCRLTRIP